MTRTRYRIFENEQEYPYFMTFTVVGWLPLFTRPQAVQLGLSKLGPRSGKEVTGRACRVRGLSVVRVLGARVEMGATAVSAVTSAALARFLGERFARSESVHEHGSQSRGTRSVVDSR
jgi:hypothetical protein